MLLPFFATKVGNLYYLEHCQKSHVANATESTSKEKLWHRRYGHLGEQNLQRIAKNKLVDEFDFNVSKSIGFCESCVNGKHHRSSFPKSKSKTSEPLEIVHFDVCGKMREKSLGGGEYFLTFTDDLTRYSWVYILKSKAEVFERFVEWKAHVERQSKHKLKILRTDNGGEYTSNQFQQYLKKLGIRHEKTVPKTPEQNGVSERLNRTIVESARCMLQDSRLSKTFWAEAVSTAVYLKNRCPTKALPDKTPYEAWNGVKPNVDNLRVFGCSAFAHIAKDERGKFDSKARKCIFLGYGETTKGYRLFVLDQKKLIYSRDVRFHEELNDKDCCDDQPTTVLEDVESKAVKLGDSHPTLELEFEEVPEDSEVTPVSSATEPLRRSTRHRHQPDYYGVEQTHLSWESPTTLTEVNSSPEKTKWKRAMEAEMESLSQHDVWDLVDLPPGRKLIGSKWVFKKKIGADGNVERFKARLVAQGFTQRYGCDYDETFCPVVRQESFRMILALAVQFGLKIHQIDVSTAFLNGTLNEEVFMKQPEGFELEGKQHLVCKLKKSLYGLKQSPRCWNLALDTKLKDVGFCQSVNDPCVYYKNKCGEMVYVGVYVDDIIIAGKEDVEIKKVKEDLGSEFDIKNLGTLNYFLGIKVEQQDDSIWIGQPAYVDKLLKDFGMENCNPVKSPVSLGAKLVKAKDGDDCIEQSKFQSAIGGLMYLSVSTRPDITYAVSSLAKFSSKPTGEHWVALKRVFRYLKGTSEYGIQYTKDGSNCILGYSDADWAGDSDDRRSTSGYVFLHSGGAISWKSQKQRCVALSTAESEYVSLSMATQEAIWLRQLNAELTNFVESKQLIAPTLIYEDNQSAIAMSRNPQFHGRSKHIEIKYHFIREKIAQKEIELEYCPTSNMLADFLTKGLCFGSFHKLIELSGVHRKDNG